jgi:hypothetical protein
LIWLVLQSDELIAIVAIEVWGAHAPSRANFGASPKSFLAQPTESRWRGANDSTRGRVRSPEKKSAISDRGYNGKVRLT